MAKFITITSATVAMDRVRDHGRTLRNALRNAPSLRMHLVAAVLVLAAVAAVVVAAVVVVGTAQLVSLAVTGLG